MDKQHSHSSTHRLQEVMWRLLRACLKPSPCWTYSALSAKWHLSSSTARSVKPPSFLPDSSYSPQLPHGFKFSFSSTKTPHNQHLHRVLSPAHCLQQPPGYTWAIPVVITDSHTTSSQKSPSPPPNHCFIFTWTRNFPAPTRSQTRQEHECHHDKLIFLSKIIFSTS